MELSDNRYLIFECRTGSYLYGTNRPDSDEDFAGVFVPGPDDLFGMQSCPEEIKLGQKISDGARNQAGDTDRKLYSLRRFLELCGEGQPGQLEMLFAPPSMVTTAGELWGWVREEVCGSISTASIKPFIGFAMAQAHKAVIKGENINLIKNICHLFDGSTPEEMQRPLAEWFHYVQNMNEFKLDGSYTDPQIFLKGSIRVDVVTNDHGFRVIKIAGRSFDVNIKTKLFLQNLLELLNRYGSRSRAASSDQFDWKSLMHAYRLCGEAVELLQTGKITLPLPEAARVECMAIRNGERRDDDHFAILKGKIADIDALVPTSVLNKKTDWKRLNRACMYATSLWISEVDS